MCVWCVCAVQGGLRDLRIGHNVNLVVLLLRFYTFPLSHTRMPIMCLDIPKILLGMFGVTDLLDIIGCIWDVTDPLPKDVNGDV